MAKKNQPRRRNGLNRQKLYGLIRTAAFLLPMGVVAVQPGSIESKLKGIGSIMTGYDFFQNKWRPELLMQGYGPLLGATLATYGIPKLASLLRSV